MQWFVTPPCARRHFEHVRANNLATALTARRGVAAVGDALRGAGPKPFLVTGSFGWRTNQLQASQWRGCMHAGRQNDLHGRLATCARCICSALHWRCFTTAPDDTATASNGGRRQCCAWGNVHGNVWGSAALKESPAHADVPTSWHTRMQSASDETVADGPASASKHVGDVNSDGGARVNVAMQRPSCRVLALAGAACTAAGRSNTASMASMAGRDAERRRNAISAAGAQEHSAEGVVKGGVELQICDYR